jgi:hypothetical protein
MLAVVLLQRLFDVWLSHLGRARTIQDFCRLLPGQPAAAFIVFLHIAVFLFPGQLLTSLFIVRLL